MWRYVNFLAQPIRIKFDHVLELLLISHHGRVALLHASNKVKLSLLFISLSSLTYKAGINVKEIYRFQVRVLKRFLWKVLVWRDFVIRDFCWPCPDKKYPEKVISSTIICICSELNYSIERAKPGVECKFSWREKQIKILIAAILNLLIVYCSGV